MSSKIRGVVYPYLHHSDLGGHGVTMEIMYCCKETLLSMIRLCGMDVTPRMALETCMEVCTKPFSTY